MNLFMESFKTVFVDMRKLAIYMFITTFLFSSLETFFVSSAFDTLGNSDMDVSSKSIFVLSFIQNIKVLSITVFLCLFVSKSTATKIGVWGQTKAQFHAFFFGVFVGLFVAMLAGSAVGFLLDESTMQMQIFVITILFGIFMIVGYWHYYIMYSLRMRMQQSGVKYSVKTMFKDTLSIFKHWSVVITFGCISLLVMAASVAASSVVSVVAESSYIGSLVQALFTPMSAVVLIWYSKKLGVHYEPK